LRFITIGDYEDQLEEDDRLEKEALLHFRQHLTPKSSDIPYVAHVLETTHRLGLRPEDEAPAGQLK
jgi:hypothetical protein